MPSSSSSVVTVLALTTALAAPALADVPTPLANVTVPCQDKLNPVAGTPDIVLASQTAADSIAAINAGRARESLPAIVIPANYATSTPTVQMIILINLERSARGLPPLNGASVTNPTEDLALNLMAFNHSQIIAKVPALYTAVNADGSPSAHENSIESMLQPRFFALPPILATNGPLSYPEFPGQIFYTMNAAENMNETTTVESAIASWIYSDSSSSYGHRSNILGCPYTNVGVGIAAATPDASGIRYAFSTLEFLGSNGKYVSTTVDPTPATTATLLPKPVPVPIGILGDTPEPVTNTVAGFAVTPNATSPTTMIDITFIGTLNAVYGFANDIRSVQIVAPALWGTTDAFGNVIGTLPADMTTIACPVVRDVAVGTAFVTGYHCTMTIPAPIAYPLQVIAIDNFDHAVIATQATAPQSSVLAGLAP